MTLPTSKHYNFQNMFFNGDKDYYYLIDKSPRNRSTIIYDNVSWEFQAAPIQGSTWTQISEISQSHVRVFQTNTTDNSRQYRARKHYHFHNGTNMIYGIKSDWSDIVSIASITLGSQYPLSGFTESLAPQIIFTTDPIFPIENQITYIPGDLNENTKIYLFDNTSEFKINSALDRHFKLETSTSEIISTNVGGWNNTEITRPTINDQYDSIFKIRVIRYQPDSGGLRLGDQESSRHLGVVDTYATPNKPIKN